MNKRTGRIVITGLVTLMLTGCGENAGLHQFSEAVTAEAWQQTLAALKGENYYQEVSEIGGKSSEKDTKSRVSTERLEKAMEILMTEGTVEFYGHNPIDQSFLSWFTETCGTEALLRMAGIEAQEEDGETVTAGELLKDPDKWYELTGKSIHVLYQDYREAMGMPLSETTCRVETASKNDAVLGFAGDVGLIEDTAMTQKIDETENGLSGCLSEELRNQLSSVDLMMFNNEFCYTDRGTPLPQKDYHFRCNPKYVSELQKLGIDYVSLANNHVYDYGEEGLTDTLQTLKEAEIPYIGAGENIDEASKPLYYILNGRKIAVVAATQIERTASYTREATEEKSGVLKTLNPERFREVIKKAKAHADQCIVIVHWGTEGDETYDEGQEALAEAFTEAGADLIIGGHTHCLQGAEYKNGVPVFYSLGNFWFYEEKEMPKDYDTAVLTVTISEDGYFIPTLHPCRFSQGTISMLQGEEAARVYEHITELSNTVAFTEDGQMIGTELR